MLVAVNGKPIAETLPHISAMDRGFLFGDAVFEVFRTYQRALPFMERHLVRMVHACSALGIDPQVTNEALATEVTEFVRLANYKEAIVKIVISRGKGMRLNAAAPFPTRVCLVDELSPPPHQVYQHGVDIELRVGRSGLTDIPGPGIKSTNYLWNFLALRDAQIRNAYECIFVGPHGEIYEGATSNVFLVDCDGAVYTPPLSTGVLPGITRALVLEAAFRLGIRAMETLQTVRDAYKAHEAFITSAIRGIVPVVRIDGVTIGSGAPGPTTKKLMADFALAASSTKG